MYNTPVLKENSLANTPMYECLKAQATFTDYLPVCPSACKRIEPQNG